MRIENLRSDREHGRPRVAADVIWEDSDRPKREIAFETDEPFSHGLQCNPHAFLVSCAIPAIHHKEQRIFIDAEICPELREGLLTAMAWIGHWYYGRNCKLPHIESKIQTGPDVVRREERSGFLFSGGIDSLALLRSNRLNYPLSHPRSFKDALIIYGQNIESDNRPETFSRALATFSEVAQDAQVTLIPVYTNVRDLESESEFFLQFHGAILASVAHVFAKRLTSVSIAASESIQTRALVDHEMLPPWGSHPLIDPNYSSSDLRIHHVGVTLSRLDKTRLMANWEAGLQSIRVCQRNWPGENCGRCEKCIRTMLALLALGVLDKTRAFPMDDLSEERVRNIIVRRQTTKNDSTLEPEYFELIAPLAALGRQDLVRAVEHLMDRMRYREPGLKEKIKAWDLRHFNGRLHKLKSLVDHRNPSWKSDPDES